MAGTSDVTTEDRPAGQADAEPATGARGSAAPSDAGRASEASRGQEDRSTGPTPRRTPLNAYAVVLTVLMTVTFLMFLLIEPTPRWLLILGAGVAVAGMDGVLRTTWREPFRAEAAPGTAPYLFLPALFALGVPILAEHNVTGYWAVAAGLGAAAGFGATVFAELASVRPFAPDYPLARQLAAALSYFVAFAIFSLAYALEVDVPTAMLAVGLTATMLGIELYREGEVDPVETLAFAAVTGLVLAEVRWALYFMPLDGYLAALALLLAFFFMTGLVHAHLTRRLDLVATIEFGAIAAVGVGLIVVARASGLA